MGGICGWVDASGSTDPAVTNRMAQALARFDQTEPHTVALPQAGIGCAGWPATSKLVQHDQCTLAVYGHPRWLPAGAAQPIGAFCTDLLTAYAKSGLDALQSVGGDFGLVLSDGARGRTILAIDRMGVRSLVYEHAGPVLLFGSTADALSAHPGASSAIDPQAIYDYVYFHMVPGPGTARRNQCRLLPGEFAVFEAGSVKLARHWSMRFAEKNGEPFDGLRTEFRDAMSAATARAMGGERSGAFLSGGTDSSTICGMIGAHSKEPAHTYSIGFDAAGYDEMEYARIAASHFKTDHHEYYVSPADVVSALPRIAEVYDQPFGNASAVPTYYCARLAKQDGVVRMLGGDGGDELFGGNARYAKQYQFAHYGRVPAPVRALLEPIVLGIPGGDSIPLLSKARSYIRQARPPMPTRYESYNLLDRLGAANVFSADFLGSVSTESPHAVMANAFADYAEASLINQMLGIDFKLTLADNDLPKVTRMCELAGVDIAFPMLDEQVVDFSAKLPEAHKLRGTQLRYFFKEALRGFLPDAIITKEKHGFGLPAGSWIQTYPPLRSLAGDALSGLQRRGIVQAAFVDKLMREYLPAHPGYYGTMAWVLMMLELWFAKSTPAPARG